MSITFNQLVNRIKTTSEDTSTEFVGDIPAFIERAEARLTREIDSYGVVQYATSNMVIGDLISAYSKNLKFVVFWNKNTYGYIYIFP